LRFSIALSAPERLSRLLIEYAQGMLAFVVAKAKWFTLGVYCLRLQTQIIGRTD